MKLLAEVDIPRPPYKNPDGLMKAFSVAMKMETICRKENLASLSAPQMGIPWNLFVCWINYPEDPRRFEYFFDCEFEGSGEMMLSIEGCGSFPGERFGIMRFPSVVFKARALRPDDQGKVGSFELNQEFSGPIAAIIQHEMDHLRGICPDAMGDRIHKR